MQFIKNYKSRRAPPLLFLVVLVIAFGLQIPKLGFYWDDWPPILIGKMQGTHMYWEFYQFDRPFSAWTYVALFPILGSNPVSWQMITLVIRWLTTVFFWLTAQEIWPAYKKQAVWAALLFAIYPTFDQQAISVAFSQHWISYLFYVISVWGMIKMVRTKEVAYAPLSYALAGVQLWTMEYFAGLELLRPIFLLIVAGESVRGWRKRINFTLKRWWPYLIIFVAFNFWRIFLLEFPEEDPNPLVILNLLQENPINGLWYLFKLSFRDTVYILFSVWSKTIARSSLELDSSFFRIAIGLSILSASVVWFALSYLRGESNDAHHKPEIGWGIQAMIVGIIAVILGSMPAWVADREITLSFYSSRFALGSMLGASLFLVGLLEWITPRNFVKVTLVSVLIALSTNYHVRTTDLYRESWEWQKQFYWQLFWRAPFIELNTPLISDNEVLLYAGGYATAMGLNLAYGEGTQPENLSYWFFALDDRLEGQINRFRNGKTLQGKLRNLEFSGESSDSLIINYDGKRCLHVLADERAENASLPASLQQALPASNLGRIQPKTEKLPPDPTIFGPEPDHTWCYYYEKAELSRQDQNWEQIATIGNQVIDAGYTPYDPIEWFVFIEGYGLSGDIEQAGSLTQDLFKARNDFGPLLCELWDSMVYRQQAEISLAHEWELLQEKLTCPAE